MRDQRGRALWLILLLGLVGAGDAQGARITDKLLAGLYPNPDSSERPIRVVPSDTPLERLEKQGEFTRVRLGDGSEGWVESRFITDEKPARIMLLELQAKNSRLQQRLRQAEARLKAVDKGQPAATGEQDDPELRTLKRQLADALAENALLKSEQPAGGDADPAPLRQRITELEQQLAEASADANESSALASLRQANRQLEQRLEQIARLAGSARPVAEEPPSRFEAWKLPLLLLALLISFIAGVAFKNYRLARRYGGLRV